jgi:hypothetical protein
MSKILLVCCSHSSQAAYVGLEGCVKHSVVSLHLHMCNLSALSKEGFLCPARVHCTLLARSCFVNLINVNLAEAKFSKEKQHPPVQSMQPGYSPALQVG